MGFDNNNPILNSPILGFAHQRIILDENGKPYDYEFLEINKTYENITGLKKSNLINHTVREVIPGIEKNSFDWISFFGEVALTGKAKECEQYSEPLKKWYRVHAYSPKKMYFSAILIDVTESKLAQEALKNEKKQMDMFFEQSLSGYFFMMLDEPVDWKNSADKEATLDYVMSHQRITKVNQAMLDQYGAKEEDFIGLTPNELFAHNIDHGRYIWKGLFEKGRWHVETEEQKMDGTPMCIDGDYILLYDEKGRVTGHFGVQLDITDQKKAKQAILESEEKFRQIAENIGEVFWLRNAENTKMIYINPAYEKVWGRSLQSIYDNPDSFTDSVYEEDKPLVFAEFERYMQSSLFDLEYRIVRGDGGIRWVRARTFPVKNNEGKTIRHTGIATDITDRKLIEEELRLYKRRLTQAQTFAKAGTWEYEIKSSKLYLSPECEELFGLDEGSFQGSFKAFLELVHPDDRELVINMNSSIAELKKNTSLKYDHRIITKKGEVRWVKESAGVTRDSKGIPALITGFVMDITDRKETEQALKISEERYRDLYTSNRDGIVRTDLEGKIIEVNPMFLKMLGYESVDELKINFQDITPEKWHDYEAEIVQNQIFKRGYSDEYEKEYIHRSGKVFPISIKVWLTKKNGKADGMWGIVRDITEKKEIELRLSAAIEGTEAGIWDWDMVNNKVVFSRQWKAMLGYSETDVENSFDGWKRLWHPDDVAKIEKTITDHLNGLTERYEIIHRCRHKDGNWRWIMTRGKIHRDSERKPYRWIGTNIDVTKQKESEEEMKKAKLLAEKASKAKSEFLANMSHEIRTPLNGVIGFTHLLSKTPLNKTQKEYLENANVSAHSLLGIINDILDLSKIEAGKLELDPVKTDIIQLIENSSDIIKYQSAQKGIELLLNIEPDIPRYALVDPVRLKQILVNLLSNAVKFTEKGEIEIKISFEKIDNRKGLYKFSIRDTGIGITEEQQKKLFKAFAQADTSTTRKYGGTGLGLMIGNMLAEKMGGKIELESQKDLGSTFYFSIVTEYEKGEQEKLNDLNNIKKVLIVDDNKNNRMIIEHNLKYWNIDCVCAEDALSALKTIENSKTFDVAIIDYQMPYIDGLELVKLIRNKLKIKQDQLPTILLYSSVDVNKVINESKELGIYFKLVKPVKANELYSQLQRLSPTPVNSVTERQTEHIVKNDKKLTVSKNSSKPVILIAEDVSLNMTLIKIILNNLLSDLEIIVATNGKQVLDKLNDHIDLILMDIQMPEMDGIEATSLIRKEERYKRIPIIALTAGATKDEKEKCEKVGMNGFLSKPVEEGKLREVLKKYLHFD